MCGKDYLRSGYYKSLEKYMLRAKRVVKDIVPPILTLRGIEQEASAPINIALIKYWGKRDEELRLPNNSSISLSFKNLRSRVSLRAILDGTRGEHKIFLNGRKVSVFSNFYQRLASFLELFDIPNFFEIHISSDVPIAAGLASSSAGFASIVLALNDIYDMKLNRRQLAILSRIGSGSATRSLHDGFVMWPRGEEEDGSDSYGVALNYRLPQLRLAILLLDRGKKMISSTLGMSRAMENQKVYKIWLEESSADFHRLCFALQSGDLWGVCKIAQDNSNRMHALMRSCVPPINFNSMNTVRALEQIARIRSDGVEVFYTQDAGSNLKLLYHERDHDCLVREFRNLMLCEIE